MSDTQDTQIQDNWLQRLEGNLRDGNVSWGPSSRFQRILSHHKRNESHTKKEQHCDWRVHADCWRWCRGLMPTEDGGGWRVTWRGWWKKLGAIGIWGAWIRSVERASDRTLGKMNKGWREWTIYFNPPDSISSLHAVSGNKGCRSWLSSCKDTAFRKLHTTSPEPDGRFYKVWISQLRECDRISPT